MTTPRPHLGQHLAVIGIGAALGTATRYGLESAWPAPTGGWPWTTFAINVAGSFLLGLLLAWLAGRGPDVGRRRLWRLGLGTGVLGGFTTYSTYAVEILALADSDMLLAAGYAVASVIAGVAAAALGLTLGARSQAQA